MKRIIWLVFMMSVLSACGGSSNPAPTSTPTAGAQTGPITSTLPVPLPLATSQRVTLQIDEASPAVTLELVAGWEVFNNSLRNTGNNAIRIIYSGLPYNPAVPFADFAEQASGADATLDTINGIDIAITRPTDEIRVYVKTEGEVVLLFSLRDVLGNADLKVFESELITMALSATLVE